MNERELVLSHVAAIRARYPRLSRDKVETSRRQEWKFIKRARIMRCMDEYRDLRNRYLLMRSEKVFRIAMERREQQTRGKRREKVTRGR